MKKKFTLLLITSVLILISLGLFSPVDARLPVYLALFSLLYVFFTLLFSIIIDVSYAKIDSNRRRFAAVILGFSPTILLALASLSSITFIDFVLATGIPIVIVWYGIRRGAVK